MWLNVDYLYMMYPFPVSLSSVRSDRLLAGWSFTNDFLRFTLRSGRGDDYCSVKQLFVDLLVCNIAKNSNISNDKNSGDVGLIRWVKVLKCGPIKNCGRQPVNNLKWL